MQPVDPDQPMIDALLANLDQFLELQALDQWYGETWEELERQFKHVYHKKLQRREFLRQTFNLLHSALAAYVNEQGLSTGRRAFIQGMVRVQKRLKTSGDYDPAALEAWAREHQVLTVPKDPSEVVRHLIEEGQLNLLTPDTQAALKLALKVYDDGNLVFTDHPVGVEEYITVPSEETLTKVLSTLAIERGLRHVGDTDPEE